MKTFDFLLIFIMDHNDYIYREQVVRAKTKNFSMEFQKLKSSI